jgi:hypothetical protein
MCGGDVQGSSYRKKHPTRVSTFVLILETKLIIEIWIYLRNQDRSSICAILEHLNSEIAAEPPFHTDPTAHYSELVQLFSPGLKTEKVPF